MLEFVDVVKRQGSSQTLSGLSMSVENKGIYGVLSADGAALTALAEVACGCADADGGEICIDGELMKRGALALKKKSRLVSSELYTDGAETVREYLDFIGGALGVEPDKRYRQIKEAFELMAIEELQNRPVSELSCAQSCRLSIAAALIGNPDVLVLNDVFRGVDGKAFEEICAVLEMLGRLKTVLLLSSKPAEVKKLCESVTILSEGKAVLSGKVEEIEAKINATREMRISVRGDWEKISPVIESLDKVVSVKLVSTDKNNVHSVSVEHQPDGRMKDILFSALSEINAPMLSVKEITLTLDDVFYSLTEKDKARLADELEKERLATEEKKARRKGFGKKRKNKEDRGESQK